VDTKTRSILKAITYRLVCVIISGALAYVFIGRVSYAIGFVVIESCIKILFYYLHERMWTRIKPKVT